MMRAGSIYYHPRQLLEPGTRLLRGLAKRVWGVARRYRLQITLYLLAIGFSSVDGVLPPVAPRGPPHPFGQATRQSRARLQQLSGVVVDRARTHHLGQANSWLAGFIPRAASSRTRR